MVWQCLVGGGFNKADRQSWTLISLGKNVKSLQVKCIRIHIDRNPIRPLTEKSFIVARDMHVGFKVQLVVEFYIYPLCLGCSQIQKIAKTPEQSHLKMSRPAHCPGWQYCLSAWKSHSIFWVTSPRQQQTLFSCAVSSGLRSLFGTRDTVSVAQRWSSETAWTFRLHGGSVNKRHRRKGAAVVLSTSFHISPQ